MNRQTVTLVDANLTRIKNQAILPNPLENFEKIGIGDGAVRSTLRLGVNAIATKSRFQPIQQTIKHGLYIRFAAPR